MSVSDEEDDELTNLEEIRDRMLNQSKSERFQVSAWDDDNVGIEPDRNPKG